MWPHKCIEEWNTLLLQSVGYSAVIQPSELLDFICKWRPQFSPHIQLLSCQGALQVDRPAQPEMLCLCVQDFTFAHYGQLPQNKRDAFQQPHFVLDVEGYQQWIRCEDRSTPFRGTGDIWFKTCAEEFILGICMGHILELIPYPYTKTFGFSQIWPSCKTTHGRAETQQKPELMWQQKT